MTVGDQVEQQVRTFVVRLDNFDGPFDLLLQLITQRRLDLTEVALSQVTDDFLAHLEAMGPAWDLDEVTGFLVIAATLLDMKAARLLPDVESDEPANTEELEARDLLFARLLAYRAYQQVTALFAELEAGALRRYPRAVTLESRFLGLLPEVRLGVSTQQFAEIAARVFAPPAPAAPPEINLDHIHRPRVSVAEHAEVVRRILRERGAARFAELVADCGGTLVIVARFLGLLHLYRDSCVAFDQAEPLGELIVRWTGDDLGTVDAGTVKGDAGAEQLGARAGEVEEYR